jgi:hypothetical protein
VRSQALPAPWQTLEVPCDPYGGGLLNIPPLSHRVRARAPLLESESSTVPPPSFFGTGLRAGSQVLRDLGRQFCASSIPHRARTLPRVGVVDGPARTLFSARGCARAHRPRQIGSSPKAKRGAGAEALAPIRCSLAVLEGTGETEATRAAPRSHSTAVLVLLAGASAGGTLGGPSQRLAKTFFTAEGFFPFRRPRLRPGTGNPTDRRRERVARRRAAGRTRLLSHAGAHVCVSSSKALDERSGRDFRPVRKRFPPLPPFRRRPSRPP